MGRLRFRWRPRAMVAADPKTALITHMNHTAYEMFGYSPGHPTEDAVGKSVDVLMELPAGTAGLHQDLFTRHQQTKDYPVTGAWRTVEAKHRCGHTFDVRIRVMETHGHYVARIEMLEQSEGVAHIDSGGVILHANTRFRELYYGTPDHGEAAGMHIDKMLSGQDRDCLSSTLARHADPCVPTHITRSVTCRRHDGTLYPAVFRLDRQHHHWCLFVDPVSDVEAVCALRCPAATGAAVTLVSCTQTFAFMFGAEPESACGTDVHRYFPDLPAAHSLQSKRSSIGGPDDIPGGFAPDPRPGWDWLAIAPLWTTQRRLALHTNGSHFHCGVVLARRTEGPEGSTDVTVILRRLPLDSFEAEGARPQEVGDYLIGGQVAEGGYSVVREGASIVDGSAVVLKEFSKTSTQKVILTPRAEAELTREMSEGCPTGIVRFVDFFETPEAEYLVLEHVQGTSLELFTLLNDRLNEHTARHIFRDLCRTVAYMHGQRVCHRDLKALNVLITADGPQSPPQVTLIDFGIAARFTPGQCTLTEYVGSPAYASPEMYDAIPYEGPEVDMWSLGVILYVMITGNFYVDPTADVPNRRLFRTLKYYRPVASKECRDVIKRLLTVDRAARITMAELMEHPWWTLEMREPPTHGVVEAEADEEATTWAFRGRAPEFSDSDNDDEDDDGSELGSEGHSSCYGSDTDEPKTGPGVVVAGGSGDGDGSEVPPAGTHWRLSPVVFRPVTHSGPLSPVPSVRRVSPVPVAVGGASMVLRAPSPILGAVPITPRAKPTRARRERRRSSSTHDIFNIPSVRSRPPARRPWR